MDMVRQCLLRDDRGGMLTSWIPAEHAVEGRRFTLKLGDGTHSDPVEVLRAYGMERPAAVIRERSHDWTRTRRASDI